MVDFNEEEDFDDEEEDQEEESAWALPRVQFSLATLMGVVTGAMVLMGLIFWLGFPSVMFLIGAAGGMFLGLLICNYFGLGFAFENLPADILKCFLISAASLAAWKMIASVPLFPVLIRSGLIINFFIYWIGMKLAWLDIEFYEIIICCVSALFVGLGLFTLANSICPSF
jgi:hypothetical protein